MHQHNKILTFSRNQIDPASRYRVWLLFDHLKPDYEIEYIVVPEDTASLWTHLIFLIKWLFKVHHYKTVVAHRKLSSRFITLPLQLLILMRSNSIFDFDDALFIGKKGSFSTALYCFFSKQVVVGNTFLRQFAKKYNKKVAIIPTTVDMNLYAPKVRNARNPLTIGWTGSAGPREFHLPLLKKVLEDLASKVNFEFLVVSDKDPLLQWKNVQYRFVEWSEENEITTLQHMDIGLMPLGNSIFDRCKCGFKLITYSAVGIPSVCAAVGVNPQIIRHGETGFVCKTEEEWVNALLELIINKNLRVQFGNEARLYIKNHYSHQEALELWRKLLSVD